MAHSQIFFRQLKLGPMENFVYLVGCESTRECLVIDPAWDVKAIETAATSENYKITGALLTHYHPDHCGGHLWGHDIEGVAELVGDLNIPVHVNRLEAPGVKTVTGLSDSDLKLHDGGDIVQVGDVAIKLIHTPGHTPGSQCFLVQNQLLAGDTLFLSGCGRVDLPGGDSDALFDSLHNKLDRLDEQTIVYPGHDYDRKPCASLHDIRRINPYLQAQSIEQWQQMFGR